MRWPATFARLRERSRDVHGCPATCDPVVTLLVTPPRAAPAGRRWRSRCSLSELAAIPAKLLHLVRERRIRGGASMDRHRQPNLGPVPERYKDDGSGDATPVVGPGGNVLNFRPGPVAALAPDAASKAPLVAVGEIASHTDEGAHEDEAGRAEGCDPDPKSPVGQQGQDAQRKGKAETDCHTGGQSPPLSRRHGEGQLIHMPMVPERSTGACAGICSDLKRRLLYPQPGQGGCSTWRVCRRGCSRRWWLLVGRGFRETPSQDRLPVLSQN
jgi:hypothetical protein